MSSKKDSTTKSTDEELLRILKENNQLMKDIKEMLRKIMINTS